MDRIWQTNPLCQRQALYIFSLSMKYSCRVHSYLPRTTASSFKDDDCSRRVSLPTEKPRAILDPNAPTALRHGP